MTRSRACPTASLVDRHFALRIRPREERTLREHLSSCRICSDRYERYLVLWPLDPRAPDAKRRLAVGLGLSPRRVPRSVPLLAAAAVCAFLIAIVLVRPSSGNARGVVARGGAGSRLFIYRVRSGAAPTPVADRIAQSDELAFAYENGAGRRRLLVFAVDEHRHVYWYHPAWEDAAADPVAVAISTAGGVHELPEAIGHAYDGNDLVLYALFTDEPLSVRTIEQWSSRAEPGVPYPNVPVDEQQRVRLQVNR
jgi:hypothetical protein